MTSEEGEEMRQGFPSVMMPVLKTLECSTTIGPIGGKARFTEASSIQVLSLSSEEDDYDFVHEPACYDASKFSHMTEEKMQVAAPGMELPFKVTLATEGTLSIPLIIFFLIMQMLF